jgi:hypothetical protein
MSQAFDKKDELIACKCGFCNQLIHAYDDRGRPKRFAKEH